MKKCDGFLCILTTKPLMRQRNRSRQAEEAAVSGSRRCRCLCVYSTGKKERWMGGKTWPCLPPIRTILRNDEVGNEGSQESKAKGGTERR